MRLCLVEPLAQEYMFLFFRQLNLQFVIYDVVSFCWPRKHLVISRNDRNAIIFQGNRSRKTYFSLPMLM